MPIKVLVVDDSAIMRRALTELLRNAPGIEVLGAASDGRTALEMVARLSPDVLTLDVQMPGMDGIAFLERQMSVRPVPVVMVSSLTTSGSETALRALELGAVDYIGKPSGGMIKSGDPYVIELLEKIRAASQARLKRPPAPVSAQASRRLTPPAGEGAAKPAATGRQVLAGSKIIFLGASTGGTEAIKNFLVGIPADCPPILIVQHMPETFTASFAARLDSLCPPRVIESKGGETIESGTVYIAPGHSHLRIKKNGGAYVTELLSSQPVNRHRPSVDVLFDSAAELVGRNALGVILTGMGKDGAEGLLRMRKAGARTFGQSEASCVVYGMPREAAQIGAVEEVGAVEELPMKVMAVLARG